MASKFTEYAGYFAALADENRLKILQLLLDGEMFAGNILKELDISQPTLSHHMKVLIESGIVVSRRDGRWVYYSVDEACRDRVFDALIECTVSDDERKSFDIRKKVKRKTDIVLL